ADDPLGLRGSLPDAKAREDPSKQLVGAHLARDLAEHALCVRELLRPELTCFAFVQQALRLLDVESRAPQCIDVPPPRGECSLPRCRITHALHEVRAQEL